MEPSPVNIDQSNCLMERERVCGEWSFDDFDEIDWLNEWTVMSHDNFVSI